MEVANRPKDCIICSGVTGSREHVFPSALGGRRKDKRIYCLKHNQWLGPHIGILQKQLEAINAMLEVQPDRGMVKSHVFQDENGERHAIKGSTISPLADLDAILDSHTIGEPHELEIPLAELPRLEERAKKRGFNLNIVERSPPVVQFRVGHYTIPLMQGGDDAMRAVAYLALTFVAHFWPHVARAPGLAAIKDMLRSGAVYSGTDSISTLLPASQFVAWSSVLDTLPGLNHPTGLGHIFVLCIRGGQVLAYVSLLDLQCWTIRLGDAAINSADRSVVVYVDPLKTGYGDDWTVHEFDYAVIDGRVDPDYLEQAVLKSERMQQQVEAVMRRVIERRDRLEAEAAQQEFDAAHRLPSPARETAIHDFVALRRQRLVNCITMFAEDGNSATLRGAVVQAAAIKATQPDSNSSDGLNEVARRVLEQVVAELSNRLAQEPAAFVLYPERYVLVFGKIGQLLIAAALARECHR